MHDQVITGKHAGLDQTGEFIGAHNRMGGVAQALLAHLLDVQNPGLECENLAPFTFLDLHRAGANRALIGLCNKLDTGKRLTGLDRSPNNFICRPTRTLRMPTQQVQQFEAPPFLPMVSSS